MKKSGWFITGLIVGRRGSSIGVLFLIISALFEALRWILIALAYVAGAVYRWCRKSTYHGRAASQPLQPNRREPHL